MLENQKRYWGMDLRAFFRRKIMFFVVWAIALVTLLSPFVLAYPKYQCYDNYTIQRIIDMSINDTSIGLIVINETCPYGCVENVTGQGAVCGYAPVELTAYSITALILFFAVIYGWARLTHKRGGK